MFLNNGIINNNWIYNKTEPTYEKNELESIDETCPINDSNNLNEEMYFDDIYNYSIDIDIENDFTIENIQSEVNKTINTPMSEPININKNVENDYIFVNKPSNKGVINTLMENSNEIIKNLKKYI